MRLVANPTVFFASTKRRTQVRNSSEVKHATTDKDAAMGVQLNQFIQGTGNGLAGRTCDGPLPDDSTFKIVFDYEGADIR